MEDRKLCSNCRYDWVPGYEWPCLDCSKYSLWCHKESEAVKKSNGKPRMAEVLGVEVGVWFRITGFKGKYCVLDNGAMCSSEVPLTGVELAEIINHPESIIRGARMTEAELERCRVYGAKYLARDKTSNEVVMYEDKPYEVAEGSYGNAKYIGSVICSLFSSVRPGDCICVEDVSELREPKLTEAELSICKAVGAKWVTKDDKDTIVELWAEKPKKDVGGGAFMGGHLIASIDNELFPSVSPGDCICIDEV